MRTDVEIYRYEGVGLSNNRNNALKHSRGDIALITDDDVTLYAEGILQLRQAFEAHPEVDFATFRSEHGSPEHYPKKECKLSNPLPKGYYVATFEIAMRKGTAKILRFCPGAGPGTKPYSSSEDELILQTAIHRGFCCRYFPITINAHRHASTGLRPTLEDGHLQASGLIIRLTYGGASYMRVALKAWRVARSGQSSFVRALHMISVGWYAAPAFRRENSEWLW